LRERRVFLRERSVPPRHGGGRFRERHVLRRAVGAPELLPGERH